MLSRSLSASEFLSESDKLLTEGLSKSKHEFHQFSFATSTPGGGVDQRTVVLRQWRLARRTIMFHTDFRSPKINYLKNNQSSSILFYSKEHKLQLRFKCIAHVHHKNRLASFLFSKTTSSQRKCYESDFPPSSIMKSDDIEGTKKNEPKIKAVNAFDNFSVCVCNFNYLDLLFLSYESHIRIAYEWDKYGKLKTTRLVP